MKTVAFELQLEEDKVQTGDGGETLKQSGYNSSIREMEDSLMGK